MVWHYIEDLPHLTFLQFTYESIVGYFRAYLRIEPRWIDNVVADDGSFAGLEVGRCINITNPQFGLIGKNLSRVGERKPVVKLQPVCGNGNSWQRQPLSVHFPSPLTIRQNSSDIE